MRMQVILDSSFARPGSAPIWGGKKGEFRDWTIEDRENLKPGVHLWCKHKHKRKTFSPSAIEHFIICWLHILVRHISISRQRTLMFIFISRQFPLAHIKLLLCLYLCMRRYWGPIQLLSTVTTKTNQSVTILIWNFTQIRFLTVFLHFSPF